MIYAERNIAIKSNIFTLRNARVSDAFDLIKYLKITAVETPYLIREPEEISLTLEQEEAFIQSKIDSEKELMLIATLDGKHIGNCSLMSAGNYMRHSHRCSVAIALYQEYCGKGIGKVLLQTVLEVAKSIGYEQAELEVVAANEPAIRLYKSLGFEIHGTFPRNMKYKNGTYADTYWMMKLL